MSHAHDEIQLVQRLREGDGSAMDAIAALHQNVVVRAARMVAPDEPSALDVAQEAFVRLWRNPASFRGGSLRAWLCAVARNIALNEARANSRRVRRHLLVVGAPVAAAPVDRSADAERLAEVREFIESLPDVERTAIHLYAVEGMSQDEVAEVLGTTRSTVKQAVLSARRKLRERFDTA